MADTALDNLLTDDADALYLDVLESLCPAMECPLLTAGDMPIHWDNARLTRESITTVMAPLSPRLLDWLVNPR